MEPEEAICTECGQPIALDEIQTCDWCGGTFCEDCIDPGDHDGCRDDGDGEDFDGDDTAEDG